MSAEAVEAAIEDFSEETEAAEAAESSAIENAESKYSGSGGKDFNEVATEGYDAANTTGQRPEGPAGEVFDAAKGKNDALADATGKLAKKLNPNSTGTDTGTTGSPSDAKLNATQDVIDKASQMNPDGTFDDVKDFAEDKEKSSTDPEEISKWRRIKEFAGKLPTGLKWGAMIAGGVLAAEFIKGIDEALSGCYVSNEKLSIDSRKLDCDDKKLGDVCTCPSGSVPTPSAINKLCPGAVDSDWTCDQGYDYRYKHYTWYGDIAGLVEGIVNTVVDAGKDTGGIFNWIKNNLTTVLIIIGVIVLVPLLLKLVNTIRSTVKTTE